MGKLGALSGSRADRFMEDELRAGFQWEKSSGLEHSCFHCTTKSNSPRALQTCYGIHSVPCNRYHQTMHAVGMSHNCDACCNFERMEDGRHRQIAELLAEIRELSNEQQLGSGTPASSSGSSRKGKARRKVAEEATTNPDGDEPEEPAPLTAPMTPMNPLGERDFNSMNSTGSNGNRVGVAVGATDPNPDLAEVENLTIHDTNEAQAINANDANNNNNNPVEGRTAAVPPSPASPDVATPSPKLSKAALRATKRAAKQAKSQLKAAKNQTKHTVSVKSADVEFVAEVIHGKMGCGRDVEGNGHDNADAGADGSEEDQQAEDEEWNPPSPPSRHPIATDTCIEDVLKRNLGYVAWIREHNAELLKACPKKAKKSAGVDRKKAGGKQDAKAKGKGKDKEKSAPPAAAAASGGGGGSVAKKKLAVDGLVDGMAVFEDTEASSVDDMDALVDAILFKFGITDSSNGAAAPAPAAASGFGATSAAGGGIFGSGSFSNGNMSSAQAAIVARLRVEIAEDLRKHENEQRMTCVRAGGFWRYAGKAVFDRMTLLDQDKEWKSAGAADGNRAARQDDGTEGGGGGGCG